MRLVFIAYGCRALLYEQAGRDGLVRVASRIGACARYFMPDIEQRRRIGAQIKAFRMAGGLTLTELGRQVGRDHSSISKYESGETDMPTSVAEAIARVLGVSMSELTGVTAEQHVGANVEEDPGAFDGQAAALATLGVRCFRVLDDSLEELDMPIGSRVMVNTRVKTRIEDLEDADVVLVAVRDAGAPEDDAILLLRQFLRPQLFTTNRNGPQDTFLGLDPDLSVTVVGTVLRSGAP